MTKTKEPSDNKEQASSTFNLQKKNYNNLEIIEKSIINILSFFPYCEIEIFVLQQSSAIKQILNAEHDRTHVLFEKLQNVLNNLQKSELITDENQISSVELAFYIAHQTANSSLAESYLTCIEDLHDILKEHELNTRNYHGFEFAILNFEILQNKQNLSHPKRLITFYSNESIYKNDSDWLNYFKDYFYQLDEFTNSPEEFVTFISEMPEEYKYYCITSIIYNIKYSNFYKNNLIENNIFKILNDLIFNGHFLNDNNISQLIKYPLALQYILFYLFQRADFDICENIINILLDSQKNNKELEQNLDLVNAQTFVAYSYFALQEFYFKNHSAAQEYFDKALLSLKLKALPGIYGLFYILNLIALINTNYIHIDKIQGYLKLYKKSLPQENKFHHYVNLDFLCLFLENIIEIANGNLNTKNILFEKIKESQRTKLLFAPLTTSLYITTYAYWLNLDSAQIESILAPIVNSIYKEYKETFPLIAKSVYDIANDAKFKNDLIETKNKAQDFLEKYPELTNIINLKELINDNNLWQNQISLLKDALNKPVTTKQLPEIKVNWLFEGNIEIYKLKCGIQKRLKNKKWGAIKEYSPLEFKYKNHDLRKDFSNQDNKIINAFPANLYELDTDSAISIYKELVNHENIYLKTHGESIRLSFNLTYPNLQIKRKENKFLIKLSVNCNFIESNLNSKEQNFLSDSGVLLQKVNKSQYNIFDINEKISAIASIISDSGILLPDNAKDQLLDFINSTCPNINIEVDSDFDESLIDNQRNANATPIIQAAFNDNILDLKIVNKPFNNTDLYTPASGLQNIIITENNEPTLLKRDFNQEKANAETLIALIPYIGHNSLYSWEIDTFEECLDILAFLQENNDNFQIEWESDKISLSKPKDFNSLRLNIKYDKDWLTLNGELKVDDNKVINLQNILQILTENQNSKFIKLSENKYLTLSNELRNKLLELNSIAQNSSSRKKEGYWLQDLKFHKLSANIFKELESSGVLIDADLKWRNYLKSLKNIKLADITLPSSIKADLRPYQIEGFKWIQQIFNLGAGACLADDMGLGKTIQTISTIAAHANEGPSIVIAPTSVCHNWETECHKFCHSIETKLFNTLDKDEILNNLKNNQLVICSYGLMQSNIDELEKHEWNIAILDEAQAIKNAATKRSKAAIRINAKHKIALTGTPIENHLGELWSIFRFLNNGLLGSNESFRKRFLNPITLEKDQNALNGLKNLIKPFVLRRLKSDVLKDLPEKTDQTIFIEPTKEEASFYQAVCNNALQNIANIRVDTVEGQKKFHILAEITKLRRACCHSTLVNKEINIESSKLKYLERLINDLKENGHKVLVFSQFVSYLKIVKELFDSHNIKYEYLDGSTPVKERKHKVENFQQGNVDVFLLSLKAGGTGLNLTKANYVIHLDPWWNPAVENQASDRAHRFGQTQKVTIYRLIMKDTIEEKIVAFHEEKKMLSEELLSDSKMISSFSEDQLVKLIKNI